MPSAKGVRGGAKDLPSLHAPDRPAHEHCNSVAAWNRRVGNKRPDSTGNGSDRHCCGRKSDPFQNTSAIDQTECGIDRRHAKGARNKGAANNRGSRPRIESTRLSVRTLREDALPTPVEGSLVGVHAAAKHRSCRNHVRPELLSPRSTGHSDIFKKVALEGRVRSDLLVGRTGPEHELAVRERPTIAVAARQQRRVSTHEFKDARRLFAPLEGLAVRQRAQ